MGGLGAGPFFQAAQSSLGAQRHPLCHPALGPAPRGGAEVPTRASRRLPCGPLTSGILLGRAVCTETPNTHSLRRSQPGLLGKGRQKQGRKNARAVEGWMLHTFVQGRSCLPRSPRRTGAARECRSPPPQSRAFSPPPSLSTFPVPGTPPRAAHRRPQLGVYLPDWMERRIHTESAD